MPPDDLSKTNTPLQRELRVRYPANGGQITIRTELDWEKDLEPQRVEDDGTTFVFTIEARRPFVYFKSCLHAGGQEHWSTGSNALVLLTHDATREVYPSFHEHAQGTFSDLIEVPSAILDRPHSGDRMKEYTKPGYEAYARAVVEELKPRLEEAFRLLPRAA